MSVSVVKFLNTVKDLGTRRAVYELFKQLQLDLAANKITINAHTHVFTLPPHVMGPTPGFAAKATADPDIKTTATCYLALSTGAIGSLTAGNIDVSAIAGYTPTALATAKQRYYLLHVEAATGTLGCTEGADHASAAVLPATPTGEIAVGWVKVANATGSNFTFGTTNLDTASLTVTYGDLCELIAKATAAPSSSVVNNIDA